MSANSSSTAAALALIADDMRGMDAVIERRLKSEVPLVSQVSQYIVAAGGKRLRPALLLLMCGALGYRGDQRYNLAAVVEFIHTATLLPSGQVLVAGGLDNSSALASTELYDPTSNTWSAAGSLTTARDAHTATLLPSGKVLIPGGLGNSGTLASAELYDPASNTWSAAGSLTTARYRPIATLLPSGQVLAAGGYGDIGKLVSAELYKLDLGFADSRRPVITNLNSLLISGDTLQLTGSGFNGDSEASTGGTDSSATNYPVVQLRRIDNDQIVWTSPAVSSGRSDTHYNSAALSGLPLGPYALTVFVNAIPSFSQVIRLLSPHNVTPSSSGNGSISPATVQVVPDGATTAFTLIPSTGYHIDSVTGTCGGSLNGSTFTTQAIIADCTVIANFAINTYTLTYTAGANGTISGTSPQTVNYGANGTAVTASPNTGYHFVQWSDSSTANPRTDSNVTADLSVTASFAINTYTVTATASANGTIAPPTQSVNYGATASFAVTPSTGYTASVSGDTCTVTHGSGTTWTTNAITANCGVTASFTLNTYTVTASAGANGTITPPTQSVNYGATASFAVTPSTGYTASVSGDTCTVTHGSGTTWTSNPITANCAVTASFAINTYTVMATAGANGTITPPTQTVNYGATASFTVTPNTGYTASVTGDTCTVTHGSGTTWTSNAITANCAVTASFAINTYTVTTTAGANGTITPPTQSVNYGGTASFTVTPVTGYAASVTGDTCSVTHGSGTTWTTDAITADCAVVATFAAEPPALAITISDSRDYASYGMLINYVVTVTNNGAGDATSMTLANALPPQLDVSNTTWICVGAGNGAVCSPSGSGGLNDSGIVIPAGRSLSWVVTTSVLLDAAGGSIDNTVSASVTASTASVTDSDTLVIFRDGFGGPSGNDIQGAPSRSDAAADCPAQPPSEIFDNTDMRVVTVPTTSAREPISTVLVAYTDTAAGFRVEQLNLGATSVRLVVVAPSGSERASNWAPTHVGASLTLATIATADGSRELLLEGTPSALAMPLPSGFANTLRIQTQASLDGSCQ